jgi:hypothetical protein
MTKSDQFELCRALLNPLTSAMGYSELGKPEKALEQLKRAHKIALELLGALALEKRAEERPAPRGREAANENPGS